MTNTRVVASTVAALALLYLLAVRNGAVAVVQGFKWVDTCWLLRMGEIISSAGAIPRTDPLTFTSSSPFVVYQWLSEVLLFRDITLWALPAS